MLTNVIMREPPYNNPNNYKWPNSGIIKQPDKMSGFVFRDRLLFKSDVVDRYLMVLMVEIKSWLSLNRIWLVKV